MWSPPILGLDEGLGVGEGDLPGGPKAGGRQVAEADPFQDGGALHPEYISGLLGC